MSPTMTPSLPATPRGGRKMFSVESLGYEGGPQYSTLEIARKVLAELVAVSLGAAKRHGGTATKHRCGKDAYTVTLGRDKNSALWAAHSIVLV